jgi:hypothetical protein
MTVRAHARRDLALILRAAGPEAENHHHAVIEAEAPRAVAHPLQVIAGDVARTVATEPPSLDGALIELPFDPIVIFGIRLVLPDPPPWTLV